MKKSLATLVTACAIAFAPAAFAVEPASPAPATAQAEYRAPAPQTAARADLAKAHAVASHADQMRAAGRSSGYTLPIIYTVLVVAIIIAVV